MTREAPVLIVPGLRDHVAEHWQKLDTSVAVNGSSRARIAFYKRRDRARTVKKI